MTPKPRDHGGGLDAAINHYGGERGGWLDLSTGINPNPYPIPDIPPHFWRVLPDEQAKADLIAAAKLFWGVPEGAVVVPAAGVSALIAVLPSLADASDVSILGPTYNEFAAAFSGQDWAIQDAAPVQVRIHPNNPDGRLFSRDEITDTHDQLTIIDESFGDICPENSLIDLAIKPNHIILKGTGKFWGLAGLRLGFAITTPELADAITQRLGPWNTSGPAQFVGRRMLSDMRWVENTRVELSIMSQALDGVLTQNGHKVLGGTDLFRLVETSDAKALSEHLCHNHILTRIFPYSETWVRFGLPANTSDLARLNDALGTY